MEATSFREITYLSENFTFMAATKSKAKAKTTPKPAPKKKAAAKKAATKKPAAPGTYAPKKLWKAGDAAPAFSCPDENGKIVSLSDFAGKKLALYFYPEDDTSTCTKEACNLRDNISMLRKKGVAILGVSADSQKKHLKFIGKYSLPFPLLADEKKAIIKAYHVWGRKQLFGREYDGIHRVTYLIDEKGMVVKAIYPVDSGDHAAQILREFGIA
jgi:thioredoxin-dependent peroxiredoxin